MSFFPRETNVRQTTIGFSLTRGGLFVAFMELAHFLFSCVTSTPRFTCKHRLPLIRALGRTQWELKVFLQLAIHLFCPIRDALLQYDLAE